MENTKLSLFEILQLESEINGVIDSSTGKETSKGLLKEVLKFKTKYWLMKIAEDLVKEKVTIDKIREELIKELGSIAEDGSTFISLYINEKLDEEEKLISRDINPKFLEFQEKYNEVLNETKEISHYKFTLEEFDSVKSAEVYPVLFKLISQD